MFISVVLQPSAVETDSEEYRTHNDTESDIEVEKGVVVIQDLESAQVNHRLSRLGCFVLTSFEAGLGADINLVFKSTIKCRSNLCILFRFRKIPTEATRRQCGCCVYL